MTPMCLELKWCQNGVKMTPLCLKSKWCQNDIGQNDTNITSKWHQDFRKCHFGVILTYAILTSFWLKTYWCHFDTILINVIVISYWFYIDVNLTFVILKQFLYHFDYHFDVIPHVKMTQVTLTSYPMSKWQGWTFVMMLPEAYHESLHLDHFIHEL